MTPLGAKFEGKHDEHRHRLAGAAGRARTRRHGGEAALNWRLCLPAAAMGLLGLGLALPAAGDAAPAQASHATAAVSGSPHMRVTRPLASTSMRPRVIAVTDGEQDDLASMHRFVLYANDLDVLGIVQTSSVFHWAGDASTSPPTPQNTWLGSDWIHAIIRSYARAYPNLKDNDPRYPTPAYLQSVVKVGNITNIGEFAKDTEGSNWIRRILLEPDETPVYISIWGGTNTVAAALRSIHDQYVDSPRWPYIYRHVAAKTWLLIDLDQDQTYKEYIAKVWPDVNVVMNNRQFAAFAYSWAQMTPGPLKPYFEAPFQASMIRKGPILADYSLNNGEIPGAHPRDWFSEGDSPQFIQQFPVGLSDLDHYQPSFGNWGGRYTQLGPHLWSDVPTYVGHSGRPTADYSPYVGADDFPALSLAASAQAGDPRLYLASVANLQAGDVVTIGAGASAEAREIAGVGGSAGEPTRLHVATLAGATEVWVDAIAGMRVGDPILIGAGADTEVRTVMGVGSPALDTALSAPLAPGATEARLQDLAGLVPGASLTLGGGAAAETVTLAAIGRPPSDFAAARAVTKLAVGATTLVEPAAAGAASLRLASVANFQTGQTVAIDAAEARTLATLGAVGVGGGTRLGLPASAGQSRLKVLGTAQFVATTPIWIDVGARAETATISPSGRPYPAQGADQEGTRAAGATTLSAPATAGADSLQVADPSGFLVGAPVTVGRGAEEEQVRVSYVGSPRGGPSGLDLVAPLVRAHAAGAPVAAAGLMLTAPLAADHDAGAPVTAAGALLSAPLARAEPAAAAVAVVTPAGARSLKVASVEGFTEGAAILLDEGAAAETMRIAVVGTPGPGGTGLKLETPTTKAHVGPVRVEQIAAQAGATRLQLVYIPGQGPAPVAKTPPLDFDFWNPLPAPLVKLDAIAVGDRVSIDEGDQAEMVRVTSVRTGGPDGSEIDFTPALSIDHAGMIKVHDGGAASTFQSPVHGSYPERTPAYTAGSGVAFQPALTRSHAQGAPVRGLGGVVVLTQPLAAARAEGEVLRSDMNPYYPQARWAAAMQNDFAARADWQLKPYAKANHPPVVLVAAKALNGRPGQTVKLLGKASDPDHDAVTYRWWQYREAGSYPGAVALSGADTANAAFVVPRDARPGQTIHLILEVRDAGAPPLTRYQRVIVTVGA